MGGARHAPDTFFRFSESSNLQVSERSDLSESARSDSDFSRQAQSKDIRRTISAPLRQAPNASGLRFGRLVAIGRTSAQPFAALGLQFLMARTFRLVSFAWSSFAQLRMGLISFLLPPQNLRRH